MTCPSFNNIPCQILSSRYPVLVFVSEDNFAKYQSDMNISEYTFQHYGDYNKRKFHSHPLHNYEQYSFMHLILKYECAILQLNQSIDQDSYFEFIVGKFASIINSREHQFINILRLLSPDLNVESDMIKKAYLFDSALRAEDFCEDFTRFYRNKSLPRNFGQGLKDAIYELDPESFDVNLYEIMWKFIRRHFTITGPMNNFIEMDETKFMNE